MQSDRVICVTCNKSFTPSTETQRRMRREGDTRYIFCVSCAKNAINKIATQYLGTVFYPEILEDQHKHYGEQKKKLNGMITKLKKLKKSIESKLKDGKVQEAAVDFSEYRDYINKNMLNNKFRKEHDAIKKKLNDAIDEHNKEIIEQRQKQMEVDDDAPPVLEPLDENTETTTGEEQ